MHWLHNVLDLLQTELEGSCVRLSDRTVPVAFRRIDSNSQLTARQSGGTSMKVLYSYDASIGCSLGP